MKKENNNLVILTRDFFPAWVYAVSLILIIAGIISVYFRIYYILPIGILISLPIWFSKKFFEFNPDTRQYRNGFYLWDLKIGKWKSLEITQGYIAFQRYTENTHYTYGGLFNRYIEDNIFEIRIIYPDTTFKPIVNGRDFKAVTKMLQLGQVLSHIYKVEFKDFVKGTLIKGKQQKP